MGISTRDANATEEEINKLQAKCIEMIPELTNEDFAVHKAGDEECEYRLGGEL